MNVTDDHLVTAEQGKLGRAQVGRFGQSYGDEMGTERRVATFERKGAGSESRQPFFPEFVVTSTGRLGLLLLHSQTCFVPPYLARVGRGQ
jgi:hypothetical protein